MRAQITLGQIGLPEVGMWLVGSLVWVSKKTCGTESEPSWVNIALMVQRAIFFIDVIAATLGV